ncbi:MAG: DUF2059 domain-containing protein [Candidatus Acidiferrales bacterium]|jgi:hypothetical protein
MKRAMLAALAFLILASVSFAQQNDADAPASKADIARYFEAMHSRELARQTMNAMLVQMHSMVHEQMKTVPNLPADAEARLNKSMDEMIASMPVDDMLDAMVPVYQKHLTKGDVDALVAFYSSPTGKKFLNEMPTITAESMQAITPLVQKTMADASDRLAKEVESMQKEQNQKSGAPAQN